MALLWECEVQCAFLISITQGVGELVAAYDQTVHQFIFTMCSAATILFRNVKIFQLSLYSVLSHHHFMSAILNKLASIFCYFLR